MYFVQREVKTPTPHIEKSEVYDAHSIDGMQRLGRPRSGGQCRRGRYGSRLVQLERGIDGKEGEICLSHQDRSPTAAETLGFGISGVRCLAVSSVNFEFHGHMFPQNLLIA